MGSLGNVYDDLFTQMVLKKQVSNEKTLVVQGIILPSHVGVIINHYEDPYITSIQYNGKQEVFFCGSSQFLPAMAFCFKFTFCHTGMAHSPRANLIYASRWWWLYGCLTLPAETDDLRSEDMSPLPWFAIREYMVIRVIRPLSTREGVFQCLTPKLETAHRTNQLQIS